MAGWAPPFPRTGSAPRARDKCRRASRTAQPTSAASGFPLTACRRTRCRASCCSVSSAQIHESDIGMHEIVSFEEERLSRRERERVREAVAEIQACAMPSLSEAAECAARQLAVLRVDWYELDACPTDEVIQVSQALGAVSRFDDDGDLDERGDGHQASISGLDCFDEGTPFGFALQDGNERRRVDDHLARQTVLVIAENLVRGSGVEDGQVGAVLRNGLELISQSPTRALAPNARKAIAERLGHRFGLGFAGLSAQLGREPLGFCIADVE